jgi:hypothetical protein
MSSELGVPRRRPHVARLKRIALTAAAVVVGAIVLSGCVVIQGESAAQVNVIGNSVTVTTVLCASQAAAAPPCNSKGNSGQAAVSGPNASASGQLLVGYRIPVGVTPPPTITSTVPTTNQDGSPGTATLTLSPSPSYTAGLNGLLPPPAGSTWVGYISENESYTSAGPQSVTIAPTFGLPAGFAGQFTWRTVVGYRPSIMTGDVTCPGPFPGVAPSVIPGQSSVCVDYPDAATINGAPNAMQIGDLAIQAPATPTISAGSSATLTFTGLFTGGNPSASAFSVAASTTIPGATPAVPASFAPAANSSTALPVSFSIPASTPVGTYDVTVSATIAGITRSGTGHVTVKPSAAAVATAKATATAKLTSSVKKTTLKVARKTGIRLTLTLSRASAISVVALQAKPKVSVTVKKTLKAGKKTIVLIKSARLHKGKVTITFKGGGLTRVFRTTLK